MPLRKIPLVNGEIYHVFNRSIAQIPIFHTKRNSERFLETIEYYRFNQPPVRFSYFNRMAQQKKRDLIDSLAIGNQLNIEILAFCIMPNHFHFLIRQILDNGISKFIGRIQNSFAKYLDLASERTGSVFQQAFKAIRIESESQFIHTARYIHLNPFSGFVIKKPEQLITDDHTSLPDYVSEKTRPFMSIKLLLSHFGSIDKFKSHTLDQADYQRSLARIKHLMNE